MITFSVIEKVSGKEVYRYTAEAPIEWFGFGFDTHEHREVVAPIMPAQPVGPRRLTKLEFQELLGDARYMAIKRVAQQREDVALWLDKFNLLTPEADGTSIDRADPRTRIGLEALIGVPEIDMTQAVVEQILGGH